MTKRQFRFIFGVLACICSNTEAAQPMIATWGIIGVVSITIAFFTLEEEIKGDDNG